MLGLLDTGVGDQPCLVVSQSLRLGWGGGLGEEVSSLPGCVGMQEGLDAVHSGREATGIQRVERPLPPLPDNTPRVTHPPAQKGPPPLAQWESWILINEPHE